MPFYNTLLPLCPKETFVRDMIYPQTRDVTAMDVWMFLCMIFVAMAMFEYAMQLKLHFGGGSIKIGNIDAKQNKIKSEKICCRNDRYALVIFLVAYISTVSTYFYIYVKKVINKSRADLLT